MTRRMIDSSMWQNEKFAELPMGGRLLLIGIINQADDQGRVKANPAYLRAQVFPYDSISTEQIQEWLELIQKNETILLYTSDGKQYCQLLKWWDYQSLQYAQPSEYPRPAGWPDRIRRTFTKGEIVTCNWCKVNGDPIPDTCGMDGKPIARRSMNGSKPPESTPKTSAQQSGASSPVHSPESSPEDTTYSFNFSSNSNDNLERDDLPGTDAPACETIHTPPPSQEKFTPRAEPLVPHKPQFSINGTSSKPAHTPLKINSPHLDPRRFVSGYIPSGTGGNPVEVFYERNLIREHKLSAPLEDDIAKEIKDLDIWRKVVTAWQQAGYKPTNIAGQLDWYYNGIPAGKDNHGNGYGASTGGNAGTYNANGRTQPGQSTQNGARAGGIAGGIAAGNGSSSGGSLSEAERKRQFEQAAVVLTAQLVKKRIDDAEYQRQYATLRSTFGLSNLPGARSLSPS